MRSTALFLMALFVPTLASLAPVSTTRSTLLSFGTARATQTYLLSTSSETISSVTIESPAKTPQNILTHFESTHVQLQKGLYNITVDLFFESWVGTLDYALVVTTVAEGRERTYRHVDSHEVYGIVFYTSSNQIVSGDENEGLVFSRFLSPGANGQRLRIITHAPEGVDMTPSMKARNTISENAELLPEGAITISNGYLSIRPADFTTGSAVIDVLCPGLEINGEVLETVLEVSVSENPAAPVVLIQANGTVRNGQARVEGEVKNGGEGLILTLDETELLGKNEGKKFVFIGKAKSGIYEKVRIRNEIGEGIVNAKLVVELLDGDKDGDEQRLMTGTTGKKSKVFVIVVSVIVTAVIIVVVMCALWMHHRSKRTKQTFIDGRPEHIARDVYGRGSIQV